MQWQNDSIKSSYKATFMTSSSGALDRPLWEGPQCQLGQGRYRAIYVSGLVHLHRFTYTNGLLKLTAVLFFFPYCFSAILINLDKKLILQTKFTKCSRQFHVSRYVGHREKWEKNHFFKGIPNIKHTLMKNFLLGSNLILM